MSALVPTAIAVGTRHCRVLYTIPAQSALISVGSDFVHRQYLDRTILPSVPLQCPIDSCDKLGSGQTTLEYKIKFLISP